MPVPRSRVPAWAPRHGRPPARRPRPGDRARRPTNQARPNLRSTTQRSGIDAVDPAGSRGRARMGRSKLEWGAQKIKCDRANLEIVAPNSRFRRARLGFAARSAGFRSENAAGETLPGFLPEAELEDLAARRFIGAEAEATNGTRSKHAFAASSAHPTSSTACVVFRAGVSARRSRKGGGG
jgi:hypothetical protein